MITEAPRDLRYSVADGEKYRKLTQDELSPFQGALFKDVFIYAAAYGFRNGLRNELERPQPNIPLSPFTDEDIWLIKGIAIAETGSLEILSNEREIYRIAEEYANGALESIYLEVFGGKPGEPYKRMAQDIWEEFQHLE
jgi:dnd system-associated protein 4